MTELDGAWFAAMPSRLQGELTRLRVKGLDELRLRAEGACGIVCDRREIRLNTRLTRGETGEILKRLCGGSLYAYADSIRQGFITLAGGVRVGVCGRAVTEKGSVVSVYDVTSLCLRIPHNVEGVGAPVARLIRAERAGVLVYSPPGVGKTTLLRSVIASLASGSAPMRLAVIDTRGELSPCRPSDLCADFMVGYPRGVGIEIAARVMSPELIVCDEIGADVQEAAAIKAAHNCGVPLLASAHAADVRQLRARSGLAQLCEAGLFSYYVGIERGAGPNYSYRITRARDAV